MNAHAVLKRAARIEYTVLRTPLHIVDDRVVQRYLNESSAVRQSFERALRKLDQVVEQLLSDAEPAPTGASPLDATDPTADAPAADEDTTELPADEVERIDALTDELLEEQETTVFAGELAEDDELRRIQAELKAKHLVEEQDEHRNDPPQ